MEVISLLSLTIFTVFIPRYRSIFFASSKVVARKKIDKRLPFFDVLKGIAIIAVILIHVAYFYSHYFENNNDFFINLINNLSRFAIPIFFICSGILLKPIKKSTVWEYYKKKFFRIFIPYILANVVIWLFLGGSITSFIYDLVTGNALSPYYFIIILLQFYIIFPLVYLLKDKKHFLKFSLYITIISYLTPSTWLILGVPFFLKYLFFFSYGIYKSQDFLNFKIEKKEFRFWSIILLLYLLIFIIFQGYYYNVRVFYGLAIIYFLFSYKEYLLKNKYLSKTFQSFGVISLWVYLIHFPVVMVVYVFAIKLNWNYYLTFIMVFLISSIISYYLSLVVDKTYNRFLKLIS